VASINVPNPTRTFQATLMSVHYLHYTLSTHLAGKKLLPAFNFNNRLDKQRVFAFVSLTFFRERALDYFAFAPPWKSVGVKGGRKGMV